MKVSDYRALYISEAEEILLALENGMIGLEQEEDRKACIDELFRHAHNLKGISGAMGYDCVVEASHSLENVLDRFRSEEIVVSPDKADLLLRAVDVLRGIVRAAINEEEQTEVEGLLGEYLVILSPLSGACTKEGKEADGAVERFEPGPSHTVASDGVGGDSVGRPGSKEDESRGVYCLQPGFDQVRSFNERDNPGFTWTRVEIRRLDRLMDMIGELIISRIRLTGLAHELMSKPLLDELASSGKLISEIQKEVMESRLVPVGQVFQRFKRLVRDITRQAGKNVELVIVGSEIGLDRTVLESMVDPLVHLIRNAVYHGIESPSERESAGKPKQAQILLSAQRERNFVILKVSDDGRGIDLERVKKELASSGLAGDLRPDLDDEELCRIITSPGFSTSKKVDMISGRGMGMNIVKKVVDSLGGLLLISSDPGKGTTITLQLPVNLSIIKALLFFVGDDIHALPIEYVRETTRVERSSLASVRGRQMLQTKTGVVPVVRPCEIFGLDSEQSEARYMKVVLVETEEGNIGLVINRIIGQQEIVIKGLPAVMKGIKGISGATILGSGKIAFIWDPRVLFEERCKHESDQEAVIPEN